MPDPQNEPTEITEMLALAHDRAPESRSRLVKALGEVVGAGPEDSRARERDIATDILRKLLGEIEMPIRRTLAERLARAPNAPYELIVRLANDAIEVARPILVESGVLNDDDLVVVIRYRTLQHRLAIAMRRQVSETVSAALVEADEDEVMHALLDNRNARIAQATLQYLVDRSRNSESLREPLLHRHELEPELAGKMYGWVSEALRRYIALNFDVDKEMLDRAIADSVEEAIADYSRSAALGDATTKLANVLRNGVIEDPQLFVRLLRAGEVALFEALFARFANLKITLARQAIYQTGGRALAVICKAAALDKPVFASIFLLARRAHPQDKSADPDELPKALQFFENLAQTNASEIVSRWRQGMTHPIALPFGDPT
ncbi:MAG: DUF2336 domain-containing protein [Rhodospirillales bacterium]|nr:DUF2336 domain-containing protein [Rhodospirillales bacterium]